MQPRNCVTRMPFEHAKQLSVNKVIVFVSFFVLFVINRSLAAPNAIQNCDARYGAIDAILPDLQKYANTHITRSFEYLMMSTHFANYQKNRVGFEKVLRELSDSTWNDAFELIKYIGKRGGRMNFSMRKEENVNGVDDRGKYELYEMESLAKALDLEKQIAKDAHAIHREATRNRNDYHDPEISSFLENHFVHRHADTIRKLSGYTSDLSSLLKGPDSSLALFLFDEYLQKQ